MTLNLLEAALRRLAPEDLDLALKHKLVPVAWVANRTFYAAAASCAFIKAETEGLRIVARVEPHVYRRAVRRMLGDRLVLQARHRLHQRAPAFSNKTGATPFQMLLVALVIAFMFMSVFALPAPAFAATIGLAASAFFLSLVSVRILCLMASDARKRAVAPIPDDLLPDYSVLVPLFRETRVLDQLTDALNALDYPAGKLDIKLVLEESDIPMQRAVAALQLPDHFDIIVVPSGSPQTKPRALNYALSFARGDLVTIFDAEDIPDPSQLKQAAGAFYGSPPEVACLQAELAFFNSNQSWISRQFAAEYASLFRIILPGLAREGLPLPLGGTSNHFRRDALERSGAWDPFNVTEDADLGIRLARLGYRCGTLRSVTLEEANIRPRSWTKQRSRWLKGFLLTWLVHMRDPISTYRDLGLAGIWSFTAMTLGVFLSALFYPLFLGRAIIDAVSSNPPENVLTVTNFLSGFGLLLFLSGYAVACIVALHGLKGTNVRGQLFVLATMPVYWIMLMPAAWLALFDCLYQPFHWRKTDHGIVKLKNTKPQDRKRRWPTWRRTPISTQDQAAPRR